VTTKLLKALLRNIPIVQMSWLSAVVFFFLSLSPPPPLPVLQLFCFLFLRPFFHAFLPPPITPPLHMSLFPSFFFFLRYGLRLLLLLTLPCAHFSLSFFRSLPSCILSPVMQVRKNTAIEATAKNDHLHTPLPATVKSLSPLHCPCPPRTITYCLVISPPA
jgi:hypothetical protein